MKKSSICLLTHLSPAPFCPSEKYCEIDVDTVKKKKEKWRKPFFSEKLFFSKMRIKNYFSKKKLIFENFRNFSKKNYYQLNQQKNNKKKKKKVFYTKITTNY